MSDWAEQRAWKVINENRELFDSMMKTHAVDIIAQALREAEARGIETREPCVCCRDVGAPKEICSDGCICSYEAAREMQRKRDAGEICAECDGPADERVKAGMKCGRCAYGA